MLYMMSVYGNNDKKGGIAMALLWFSGGAVFGTIIMALLSVSD